MLSVARWYFPREQRVFIIKHYFLTKSCNKVRQQYEEWISGANLQSNKTASHVICKFEKEYSIDDSPYSYQLTVQNGEERGSKKT